MQSALAKERREVKQAQREAEMDSIPTGLNKHWVDPLPDSKTFKLHPGFIWIRNDVKMYVHSEKCNRIPLQVNAGVRCPVNLINITLHQQVKLSQMVLWSEFWDITQLTLFRMLQNFKPPWNTRKIWRLKWKPVWLSKWSRIVWVNGSFAVHVLQLKKRTSGYVIWKRLIIPDILPSCLSILGFREFSDREIWFPELCYRGRWWLVCT